MRNKFLYLFTFVVLLFTFTNLFANPIYKANTIKRVIYITVDGVRWQEVYLDHSYLPLFWEKYANAAALYGVPDINTMKVASIPLSEPSYFSQMSGQVTHCITNSCGRIPIETFPELLKRDLHLQTKDLAVFASWITISDTVEHIEGTIYSNTGNIPAIDPVTQVPDEIMAAINLEQEKNNPGNTDRFDQYTFAQAMHYFDKYMPPFLWISLNDTDTAAHHGDLDGYRGALAFFDQALDQLITTLKARGLYEETMIIITTDHGRGDGDRWTDHGFRIHESKQTWAFVFNGVLLPVSQDKNSYSTLSIRPTVEFALKDIKA